MQPCSLRCRWTCQSVKTLVKTSKCSAYTLLDGLAYVWIFCELRSIVPSPAGVKKNTNDEQNARSHYMLNHQIRGLLFHYKKKLLFSLASIFLVRVFRNILIPSENDVRNTLSQKSREAKKSRK